MSAFILFCGGTATANTASAGFRQAIELQERLSSETMEWQRLRSLLQTEINFLEKQLAETDRQMVELTRQQTEALEERKALLSDQNAEEIWMREASRLREKLQSQVRSLSHSLPPWLPSSLELKEMPDDLHPLEWVDTVLRQVTDLIQWNQRIETGEDILAMENGEELRIDLLTFGWGGAYYTAPGSGPAGFYRWDGLSWIRVENREIGPGIRKALAQYRGESEPEMILLPAHWVKGRSQ